MDSSGREGIICLNAYRTNDNTLDPTFPTRTSVFAKAKPRNRSFVILKATVLAVVISEHVSGL